MKLKVPELNLPIEIHEGRHTEINIEDRILFREIVTSIHDACQNQDTASFLWDGHGKVPLWKKADIIFHPANIDFTSRSVQTALMAEMRKLLQLYPEIQEELQKEAEAIRCTAYALIDNIGLDCICNPVSDISGILKILDFDLIPEDESLAGKMKHYMDLCAKLKIHDYLFCINFKSYFDEEEITELSFHSAQSGINLIYIDRSSSVSGILINSFFEISEDNQQIYDDRYVFE